MCTYSIDIIDIDNVMISYQQLTFHTPLHVHTISTMLWWYHIDIDNWLSITLYMYIRYRQCCDDIDKWLPIHYCVYVLCWYRRYWQCCDDIVSISTTNFPCTSLCMYGVDIDNTVMILWRYRQYCDDIVSISTIEFSLTSSCTYTVNVANQQDCFNKQKRIYYRLITLH
jgi:hypothetical protein